MKLEFRQAWSRGFTLIELSIVLVIIGLIAGAVLAGQSLITASYLRATISQIIKYDAAALTFRIKYASLPGDMTQAAASQVGFTSPPSRAGTVGRGDGNGVIEGISYPGSVAYCWNQDGETLFFWEDLASAKLIDTSFTTATDAAIPAITDASPYLPTAKVGQGNFIYVFCGTPLFGSTPQGDAQNYYGLSAITSIDGTGNATSNPGLTVAQAYDIDAKIDDGLPKAGRVQAFWPHANGATNIGWAPYAITASATTCFDTTNNVYSIKIKNGMNMNCGLSFKFQ